MSDSTNCNPPCCGWGTPINAGDGVVEFCYVDLTTQCQKKGWKVITQTDPECPDEAKESFYDIGMVELDAGTYQPLSKCPDEVNIANLCQLVGLLARATVVKSGNEAIIVTPSVGTAPNTLEYTISLDIASLKDQLGI